ncbi:hypothetical protein DSM106972_052250 [Dulcicalothrix desertica PCC 7102]|uniref:Uncharacterized protein n=1 Tax=Dulcicalothrix desertica PCC 7102 TaxID=232991 RepID=A0A3S1AL76_9CYAN|nr:hypothetical protein [Dulcicalothrix desertica]RUT03586.1 hypothetical protein DSM106972_052250 [Dulcicalothrix desertica PCC 7102]TWH50490.1 hypothetical protein CAL7102_04811 [Dulcicalothrix desertica PCC 7102]
MSKQLESNTYPVPDYGPLPEDATKLQQFQHAVLQEFMKALDNSQMDEILKSYGLTAEKVIRFDAVIDLNKIQRMGVALSDQEMQQSLEQIPGEELKLLSCCWCGRCCPC